MKGGEVEVNLQEFLDYKYGPNGLLVHFNMLGEFDFH